MKDFDLQPAGDLGLTPRERVRSVEREPGLVTKACRQVSGTGGRAYLRLAHRLSVEGAEHLPAAPPYVIVANHESHLDTIALTCATPRPHWARLHPLAADDYFFQRPARAALTVLGLNALPLRRGRAVGHSVKTLRARLEAGRCALIVFPQGTRGPAGGAVEGFKPGVGMLVAGLDVPVVPAWLSGCGAAWPKGRWLPRPGAVRVRFGPTQRFADEPDARAGWAAVASTMEANVAGLAQKH